jgi:hypothetical protein
VRRAIIVLVRPDYGRTNKTVGLGHECDVWHDKPLPINWYTIAPILRVPVDILHPETNTVLRECTDESRPMSNARPMKATLASYMLVNPK